MKAQLLKTYAVVRLCIVKIFIAPYMIYDHGGLQTRKLGQAPITFVPSS